MKIAVSATGLTLDAEVDPRFGRCRYFVIIDPETMQFEAFENPNVAASGGAGIGTATMIASKGVDVVLTGNCGPNAYQTLAAAGIQVVTGASGRIRDAVQAYKSGKLRPAEEASVGSHWGIGAGRGMRMGRSMPTGLGAAESAASQPGTADRELELLKNQVQSLERGLAEIERRLENLEKKR